jgi:uncharacterized membrane protein
MRGKGLIVGIFCGILVGLLFKKPAIAILLGLAVAYIVSRSDQRNEQER